MGSDTVRRIFYLILGLAYLGAGVYIFLKKILPSPWGLILMILFGIYGLWRIYRGLQSNV